MTPEQFKHLALSMPEAAEGSHFDVTDFRVGGKIFATFRPRDGRAVLLLTRDDQTMFIDVAPDAFEPVPGGWGEKGSTVVKLDHAQEDVVSHAMQRAWRKVAPKRLLQAPD